MIKKLFLIFIIFLFCTAIVSADINITPVEITSSSVRWEWNAGYNITEIVIDGNNYPLENNTKIKTRSIIEQLPNTKHSIEIYTLDGDSGENITYTLPDNAPITAILNFIVSWMICLIVPLIICIIAIYMRLPFLGYIAVIFSGIGILTNLQSGFFNMLIGAIMFIVSLYVGFNQE